MITENDIKKIETKFSQTFATKAELKNVKSELKTEIIVLRVELKKEMKEFKEEMMIRFDRLVDQIREIVSEALQKEEEQDKKLKSHAIRLSDHEERIRYLEM